jgi:hypothetical protein
MYGFSSVNDIFSSCLENLQTFQYHKIEIGSCAHQSNFPGQVITNNFATSNSKCGA